MWLKPLWQAWAGPWTRRMPGWATACLQAPTWRHALALGVLLTFGFAPFFVWPLAVLSLAVVWRWLAGPLPWRRLAGLTLVWAMAHQVTALYWLPRAFYADGGESWLAALVGGVPAMLGLALFGALGMLMPLLLARGAQGLVGPTGSGLLAVALWLTIEGLKTLHPIGFPWLPLGAMAAGSLPLMQLAAWGDVLALSSLFLLMGWLFGWPQPGGRRNAWRLGLGLLVLAYGTGLARLALAPSVTDLQAGQPLVRLVQPNIQSPHKWDAARRLTILHDTLAIGFWQVAPASAVPQLVIFPETAVAFYMNENPEIVDLVASRLTANQAVLTGTVRREPSPDGQGQAMRYFNSAAMVRKMPEGNVTATSGTLVASMDKHLLVPFGEYLPWRQWWEPWLPFGVRTMSQSRLDYSFGTASPVLPTPIGPVLNLICYEGIFPGYVHHEVRANPSLVALVNITNDNWFTGTTALYQHAALARLRAVATGLPLLRAANTGISVVYDGYGRQVARLRINTAARTDVRLPRRVGADPLQTVASALPLH